MGILGWIVLGLIAGAVAKLLMPGRDPGGLIMTILLGIGGAIVGGFVGSVVGLGRPDDLSLWSILLSVGGALLLLAVYRSLGRRGFR